MSLCKSIGRKDAKTSGYYRVFAEQEDDDTAEKIASVMSKIQACVISNGCLLDSKIIPSSKYNPNDVRLKKTSSSFDKSTGHYAKFKVFKKDFAAITGKNAIEIDYVVIDDSKVSIFEIKDGDNFDTKKSKSEYDSLSLCKRYFQEIYPKKDVSIHIVLWNAKKVEKTSIKIKDLPEDVVMTGRQFSALYDISYEKINKERNKNGAENKKCLKEELENIINSF